MEKVNKNTVIRVCLTSTDTFYEDALTGEWLSLPAEKKEIQKAMKHIKASPSNPPFITFCYTNLNALNNVIDSDYNLLSDSSAIYKLNELAETLCTIPPEDYFIINTIANELGDFYEALKIYQEHEYRIYENCTTMEDVAYKLVNSKDFPYELSDFAKDFFDYSKYGETIIDRSLFVPMKNLSMLEIFI